MFIPTIYNSMAEMFRAQTVIINDMKFSCFSVKKTR